LNFLYLLKKDIKVVFIGNKKVLSLTPLNHFDHNKFIPLRS